jgi:hypothetical protein
VGEVVGDGVWLGAASAVAVMKALAVWAAAFLSASRSIVGVAVGCEALHADKSKPKHIRAIINNTSLFRIFSPEADHNLE